MKISKITLGTVNFGMNYGLRKNRNKVTNHKAKILVRNALKLGINSFDTSPNYGDSEKIIGKLLKHIKNKFIATKIQINNDSKIDFKKIDRKINQSRKNLFQKKLDLLQIHNAKISHIKNSKIKIYFKKLKSLNIINKVGVSIYTEKEALEAIKSKWIDSIQVPFNVVNQKMKYKIFNLAKKNKVKIFTRSTLLKGFLTDRIIYSPKKLIPLKKEIEKKFHKKNFDIKNLKSISIRFVLSNDLIDSVVFGVENPEQLKEIINLKKKLYNKKTIKNLEFIDSKLKIKDPRYWPFV